MNRAPQQDQHPSSRWFSRPLASSAVVALGLVWFDLLWLIEPVVQSSRHNYYHWSGSGRELYGAVAINCLLYWLAVTLLLTAAARPGRLRVAIWGGILCFTPWAVLQNLSQLTIRTITRPENRCSFLTGLLLTSLLTWLWRPAFYSPFERIIGFASRVFSFTAIFTVYLLLQMAWYGFHAVAEKKNSPPYRQQAVSEPPSNRIIWIIFDELAYRQVFEDHSPATPLPTFDAVAAESTVFTHVVPIDIKTELVLPALITGHPDDAMQITTQDKFLFHSSDSGRWMPLDEHDSVFQDALRAGYSTAVVGWYNPYCRMFPQVLDSCFWVHNTPIENSMRPPDSLLENMLEPLNVVEYAVFSVLPYAPQETLLRWLKPPHTGDNPAVMQIMDYVSIKENADRVLRDPSASFVLLHLPIPHPIGIYSRATGSLTSGPASYLDNLVLADNYLAHVRSVLQQQGEWDNSTVIIMGDHSWRTKQLWRGTSPAWTHEEELASKGGQYDERPAYLVKMPFQTTPYRFDPAFHALNTRSMMDALLEKKINNPAELNQWATAAP